MLLKGVTLLKWSPNSLFTGLRRRQRKWNSSGYRRRRGTKAR